MNPKKQIRTSPAGIARWVCVVKPSVKFNPDGQYSVDLLLPPEQAEPMIAEFKKMAEQAKADAIKAEPKKAGIIKGYALHVPGDPALDKEGNETGDFVFKFKANALIKPKGKDPFEKKVGVFDAKGKPMVGVNIGSGSRLKVAYEAVPFTAAGLKKSGVTLRLSAVQVLDLVKYTGGGNAESFGFGEEDGYSYADAPPAQDGPGPSEDDAAPSNGNGTADF